MGRSWPKNITKIPGVKKVAEIGDALLILGDCLTVLPHLAGHYDAIISDTPYGIRYNPSSHTNTKWRDVKGIVGDDMPFDPKPLLGHVETVVLFGANNFASRLPDSRHWIVWDKRPGMKPMSFSDCELGVVLSARTGANDPSYVEWCATRLRARRTLAPNAEACGGYAADH